MVNTLQQGENIALNHLNNPELVITTQWHIRSMPAAHVRLSAFLLTQSHQVRNLGDIIHEQQPSDNAKAVLLKDNMLKVNLTKMSADIHQLSWVLSLHHDNTQVIDAVALEQIIVKVFDLHTKEELINYVLNPLHNETAIILISLYRHQQQWKCKAVGQGFRAGLPVLAQHFGIHLPSPLMDTYQKPIIHFAKKTITSTPPLITPEIDLFNTTHLSSKAQYQPIEKWFNDRQIEVTVNESAMDTTGFFDELAVALGEDFQLLKVISSSIKRRQLAAKNSAYIDIENYNKADSDKLKKFCKLLYEHSFVAKYFYQQKDNKIGLHLQSATRIVQFFNGEWLEWFAFMKVAQWCQQQQKVFSCVRNIKIACLDSRYEVDVFFLIDNKPLFIECKSGEYRQFIDKYSKLRKNLAIAKPYFLYLTAELDDNKAQGLTATFEITFMNPSQLIPHLKSLF